MAHTSETGLHAPLPARSYRYPGATPFSVEQEHIFFGRAQDTENLFRLVRRETMVVLYGKSGLGKSSLINAGLIPRFREEGAYHPVSVRFYAHSEGSTESPLAKVKAALSEGFSGETFIDSLLPGDDSLWFHAKRRQLQGGGQPLLLFDQFEELFGYPDTEVNALQLQLAELRHTGLPLRLRRRLEDPLLPALSEEQEDLLEKPLDLRLLFAVRSDRLHLLNRLKDHLPFAMHQAYELQALLPEDAKEAIVRPAAAVGQSFATPAFAFSPEALNRLLDFLGDGQDGRVEGILLQMLCEYYERGQVEGKNGPVLLGLPEVGNPNDVVRNYYRKKISDLPAQNRAAASRLIEEGLVSESQGIRLSLHEANIASEYEVDATTLNALVDSRLLRAEPFPRGGYAYELSHDRLIPAVLEAREESRQAKAREKALRQEEALLQEKARREEAEAQRAVAEQALSEIRLRNLVMFREFVELGTNLIYTLDHEEALEKLRVSCGIDVEMLEKRKLLCGPLQELLYFYGESCRRPELAVAVAGLLLGLGDDRMPLGELGRCVSGQWDNREQFKSLLFALPDYVELSARYYPLMVEVPTGDDGEFEMGSEELDWGHESDETLHRVRLLSYRMGVTAVTFYQYALYSEATGRRLKSRTPYWGRNGDHPVVNVNWYEALEYANWLNEQLGYGAMYDVVKERGSDSDNQVPTDFLKWKVSCLFGNRGYRLPTEAEWELASRGGVGSPRHLFSGGDAMGDLGWYWENSGDEELSGDWDMNRIYGNNGRTHTVGRKKGNGLGLYDMSGNVWEWCWDWYGSGYYGECKEAGTVSHPLGPKSSSDGRVLRGGSWLNLAGYCRSAYRTYSRPVSRRNHVGFRLVFVP